MLNAQFCWPESGLTVRPRVLTGAVLIFGLLASSGAQAQSACVDNTTPGKGGFGAPYQNVTGKDFIPFSQGSGINSLVSVIDTANTAFLSGTTAFYGSPGNPRPNQPGGGIWTRGIVGTATYNNTGVANVSGATGTTPQVPVSGSIVCNTKTKQDFAGFQMGRDLAQLNFDKTGWNLHWGLTAGWFEADAHDTSPGGTFTGQFSVPFAGFYGVATNGGFFADAQVRWDFFDNQLNDPANGLVDQHFNAEGIAVTGNAGYRYDFVALDRSKWFIEPSIGGVWSNTSVDQLELPGTLVTNSVPPATGNYAPNQVAMPGSVQISDIESILGRASLRVGTNFVDHNIAWQPFATASVFREFAGDVTTHLTTRPDQLTAVGFQPGFPNLSSTQTTSRVGTYGQFGLGLAGQIIDTGWLGYARVDYRTGENIEGVSGNIGLRYQFNPGPTALPSLKGGPAPAVYAPVNWTGFYVGGFGGALIARQETLAPAFGTTDTIKAEGYLLGGQAGYNYQTGPWVIGVEADIGGSNAEGGHSCPNGFFFTCHVEVDDLASVTGRLGYAWERALFYVKGGLAIGEVAAIDTQDAPFGPGLKFSNSTPVRTTNTQTGWTIGTGAEFALTQNWSAKGEWMYYDLGSDAFVVTTTPGDVVTADTTGQVVRVGVNYHFGH